jgi:hypothetical protein
MSHTPPRLAARSLFVTSIVAGCLALAACGSSSPASSSSSSAAATTASTTATQAAATTPSGSGRGAALRACLKKQGITLPNRTPGSTPPAGGGGGGGGILGGGGGQGGNRFANNPKLQAALKKCGANFGSGTGGNVRNSAAYKTAVNNFVACVRKNGYNLPAPNLSGKGPVFSASKVNQKDPKFIAASKKCASLLNVRRPASSAATTSQ